MPTHLERQLHKLHPGDLEVGMYVAELDRPWLESPFLFQGFRIESTDELEEIRQTCDFVYVDFVKSVHSSYGPHGTLPQSQPQGKPGRYTIKKPAEQELPQAYREYRSSLASVEQMLQEIQRSRRFDSGVIRRHIKQCTQSILRNPAAMMWLTRIKHADNYTAEHCLNVGVLAISLGRHLGFEPQDLETLGLCGILHDVGKTLIKPEILNKAGALTAEEFEHIKQHPKHARSILAKDPALNDWVLEAAFSHHERMDGHGYPQGVDAGNLNIFSRIITVVDAYDAMTSKRCYSDARPVSEALKILYENRDTQFDSELAVKFIECIGVYPPGCLVEMDTGEVGYVISNTPEQRLLPRVALLLDRNKHPMTQHIVNLNEQGQKPEGERMHIRTVLRDGSHGLKLETYTLENLRVQQ